jgi:hypothetical protein
MNRQIVIVSPQVRVIKADLMATTLKIEGSTVLDLRGLDFRDLRIKTEDTSFWRRLKRFFSQGV